MNRSPDSTRPIVGMLGTAPNPADGTICSLYWRELGSTEGSARRGMVLRIDASTRLNCTPPQQATPTISTNGLSHQTRSRPNRHTKKPDGGWLNGLQRGLAAVVLS